MKGRVAEEMEEQKVGKTGSKSSQPDWHGDRDKGGTGNKGKGKGQERNPILLRLRRARAHRSELSILVG